ncbi:MAG: sugar phosphate nucleotidyltransferase [Thermoplasmata archaeon]|nr:sugar phosphate nucleotidyltransferase [Thermoplasmata archaeon]
MQAVILAAGYGKRLWPFSEELPKPMLPIANKPLMEHLVDALAANNIRDIIIVVGYKKERILSYFQDGKKWEASIRYVVQNQQLGTAHALYQARNLVKEEFLILPGDNLVLPSAIASIKDTKGNAVLLTESEDPSEYGVAYVSGKILKTIVEKPAMPDYNIISTSIFKFDPSVFDEIERCLAVSKYELSDLIRECAVKREISAITMSSIWKDVMYPWSIVDVNAMAVSQIRERIAGTVDSEAKIRGKVSIGEDTVIHPGTCINGPVIIGSGSEIGPSAVIYPCTSIGNNVKIAPFSVIENTVIMDNSAIGPHSTLQSCVIGEGTTVESELKALAGDSTVEVEGKLVKIKHAGGILGARCIVQHGVFMKPGTTVGNDCRIHPNAVISGRVPSRAVVM